MFYAVYYVFFGNLSKKQQKAAERVFARSAAIFCCLNAGFNYFAPYAQAIISTHLSIPRAPLSSAIL